MSNHLQQVILQYRATIEEALFEHLPRSRQVGTERYNEALHYAVFPGGKRWRPMLTLLGGMIVGTAPQHLLPAACAIEYLHTSSMIIDDLPAMDDADLRRGKPSLHLAFDESTALLVSLGLMNQSYALLALSCQKTGHSEVAGQLLAQATALIGSDGMIGGQVVDLELRNDCLGRETLESRNLKTTALTRLMMTAGPIAAKAHENEIATLAKFGEALGMAYQICDDLLDEIGEYRAIGKPLKQDERHRRPSFVAKYGVMGAQRLAHNLINEGIEHLHTQFGPRKEVQWLSEAAQMIIASFNLSVTVTRYDLATVS